MKNTFGNNLSLTLFGESHGPSIGAVLDGLSPGMQIDEDAIRQKLSLRRPCGKISTARHEADAFQIVSGVYCGYTTGTPLCILISNEDKKSEHYESLRNKARPGHADYTAEIKYMGFQDPRGGGHFSGRITAALVAAGAVVQQALAQKGICIGTHIAECAGIKDRPFGNLQDDLNQIKNEPFAVLDESRKAEMIAAIERAATMHDSVGGILETVVTGMPAGVGEPWFDTVEGMLAHAMFSIPAVKGVSFGAGFGFAQMTGSEANDAFRAENGQIHTVTNQNGGVNGGITNGMPILFRCAVKPTPSISQEQDTVDYKTAENVKLTVTGRHDPAVVHRARAVVDSLTALTLGDLLLTRFGANYLGGSL